MLEIITTDINHELEVERYGASICILMCFDNIRPRVYMEERLPVDKKNCVPACTFYCIVLIIIYILSIKRIIAINIPQTHKFIHHNNVSTPRGIARFGWCHCCGC